MLVLRGPSQRPQPFGLPGAPVHTLQQQRPPRCAAVLLDAPWMIWGSDKAAHKVVHVLPGQRHDLLRRTLELVDEVFGSR